MPNLLDAMVPLLAPVALLFDARIWRKTRRLGIGTMLALVRITLWTGDLLFHGLGLPPIRRNRRRCSRPGSGSSSATPAEHPCDSPA